MRSSVGVGSEARELSPAREGLSWRQRRAALRAVRWGRSASAHATARFAVATATEFQRRRVRRHDRSLVAGASAGIIAFAVCETVADGFSLASGVLLLAAVPVLCQSVGRVGARERARRCEERNRRLLSRAGQPFAEGLALVPGLADTGGSLLSEVIVSWVITDLVFGVLQRAGGGHHIALTSIVDAGAIFASVSAAITYGGDW